MSEFADIYRKHQEAYSKTTYHPVRLEVIENKKIFAFEIDWNLLEIEKIEGIRKATLKATFPLKEAMNYFFTINKEVYGQKNFLFKTIDPQVYAILKKMHIPRIRKYDDRYKIGENKLRNLIERELRCTEGEGRQMEIASYDSSKSMIFSAPNLIVKKIAEPQKKEESYELCNTLTNHGCRNILRQLMSLDDAIKKLKRFC